MKLSAPRTKLPWSLTLILTAVCLLDGILTLWGQKPKFWANYTLVNEGDPLAYYILTISPHLFAVSILALAAGLTAAVRLLPFRFSLPVWLFFFVTHVSGSLSWLPMLLQRRLGMGWISAVYIGYYPFALLTCVPVAYIAYRHIWHGRDKEVQYPAGRRPRCLLPGAVGIGVLALVLVIEPFLLGSVGIFDAIEAGNLELVTEMLKEDPSLVSEVSERHGTPLHAAIAKRKTKIKIAELLLARGADVNASPEHWWTPLVCAISGHQRHIFEMLLENGADINARDDSGDTPLHHAVLAGNAFFVKRLLEEGADANVRGGMGETPLYETAIYGRSDIAALLLDFGAEPDAGALSTAAGQGHLHFVKLLLEHGVDINARAAPDMLTALYHAASSGHVRIVEILLRHGVDVNATCYEGWTPLHMAAREGHQEVAELLLESGANPDVEDENGWTPLEMAATDGKVSVVELLISHGVALDPGTDEGKMLLHRAALRGHKNFVDWLVERGAQRDIFAAIALKEKETTRTLLDVEPGLKDAVSPIGGTPLHWAALAGDSDTADLLISLGADIDAMVEKDMSRINPYGVGRGGTPLHAAIRRVLSAWIWRHKDPSRRSELVMSQFEVVRLLLKRGADVNAATETGVTPLHMAANSEELKLVELLLDNGADPNAKARGGSVPLFSAININDTPILRMLLERGADATAAKEDGDTPLHAAAGKGYVEGAQLLLDHGADANAANAEGRTPLHCTALRGNVKAAQLLLAHGADPAARDRESRTPLHLAAAFGNGKIVEFLLAREMPVAARDSEGLTPLHMAAGGAVLVEPDAGDWPPYYQVRSVVDVLLANGADINARDNDGRTPLHLAAQRGDKAVVEFFISKGADVTMKDADGNTPFDIADKEGHEDIAALLRKHMIQIGITDTDTPTAIENGKTGTATNNGSLETLKNR